MHIDAHSCILMHIHAHSHGIETVMKGHSCLKRHNRSCRGRASHTPNMVLSSSIAATEATGSERAIDPTSASKHLGRLQHALITRSCSPSAHKHHRDVPHLYTRTLRGAHTTRCDQPLLSLAQRETRPQPTAPAPARPAPAGAHAQLAASACRAQGRPTAAPVTWRVTYGRRTW